MTNETKKTVSHELLHEKLSEEFTDFMNYLQALPAHQIIEKSYEKVIKEELFSLFEAPIALSDEQIIALYGTAHLLEDLYQAWLSNDLSMRAALTDTISIHATSLIANQSKVAEIGTSILPLLLELIYTVDNQVYHFKFTGTATYEQRLGETSVDFYDLSIIEVVNGIDTPFAPKGHTWEGRKLDENDAIADVLFKYCVRNPDVNILYIDTELQLYMDELTAVTITGHNNVLPKKILYGPSLSVYEIYLVTDKYTYYALDDSLLMLDTESRHVVSSNYFAEVGYCQSEEAIRKGDEKLYFCAYPFSDTLYN